MELAVDVACSELLDSLRAASLERQLSKAFRDQQKEALTDRTWLERRLTDLHEQKLAKLGRVASGYRPGSHTGGHRPTL